MDLETLCNKINLQPAVKSRVFAFAKEFDFQTVQQQLKGFLDYTYMETARSELVKMLGEDKDRIRVLACMLKASADVWEIYQQKGICDEIYVATMKCYPRFISETYQRTGRMDFDRDWWTVRQAGCHLFRIGELEYEVKQKDMEVSIGLHIPSDADLTRAAVDQSLESAKEFFHSYSPKTANAPYDCNSWLLDGQLRGMLSDTSNIIDFQKRFEIVDEGEDSMGFMEWVYHRSVSDAGDLDSLPENTSLQRNMKKHLLAGGGIRSAYGKLI